MASGHRLIKSIEATTVKQAVIDTLAPKETKYDYVAVREAFGEIDDGLPLVTVDLRPGREAERKKALVDAIAAILRAQLGVDPVDLYVLFRETPAENHYTGGSPRLRGFRPINDKLKRHPLCQSAHLFRRLFST